MSYHPYISNISFWPTTYDEIKNNNIIVRFMVYIQVQCIYKQTFRAPKSGPFSMHVTREEIVK